MSAVLLHRFLFIERETDGEREEEKEDFTFFVLAEICHVDSHAHALRQSPEADKHSEVVNRDSKEQEPKKGKVYARELKVKLVVILLFSF